MTDIVEYCADGLPALLRLLGESDVELLEIQDGDTRVRVHRAPGAQEALPELDSIEPILPAEPAVEFITSPLVGTFYRAGKPGMAPLASEGMHVDVDMVVGLIEVLGESIDVLAGCNGEIVEVLATDGDAVEYGSNLFRVILDG
jgi:acetyl-CoA carboxylase biotin carboxyl carrier protein